MTTLCISTTYISIYPSIDVDYVDIDDMVFLGTSWCNFNGLGGHWLMLPRGGASPDAARAWLASHVICLETASIACFVRLCVGPLCGALLVWLQAMQHRRVPTCHVKPKRAFQRSHGNLCK
jgi:hypothetical protein